MKPKRTLPVTLDELARMMQKEFSAIHAEFADMRATMATKAELENLRKETQAGFAYMNITLDKHMGDVRETTDTLAHR